MPFFPTYGGMDGRDGTGRFGVRVCSNTHDFLLTYLGTMKEFTHDTMTGCELQVSGSFVNVLGPLNQPFNPSFGKQCVRDKIGNAKMLLVLCRSSIPSV